MKLHVILLFSLLTLVACNRNDVEGMQIHGKIRDSRNSAGVAGVSVEVQEKIVESGALNGSFQFAAQVNTDGSGNYTADFERNNALIYKMNFTKQGYFSKAQEINPDNLTPGVAYTVNQTLVPEAFVQVNIRNANPLTEDDFMRFRYVNANFDCECCNNAWTEFEGTMVDSSFTCRMHGDYMLYYTYEVTRVEEEVFTDSVFCHAFQTTVIDIDY